MKVVFPQKGSIVLLKQDLETLEAFYNTSILSSKMFDIYKTSDVMVQVGNFNYIPQKSSLVLYKANLLTIEKMRKILGIYAESTTPQISTNKVVNSAPQKSPVSSVNSSIEKSENKSRISDNDLLSNPFFQTLKPLN